MYSYPLIAIPIGVIIRSPSNPSQIVEFLSRVTLKFDEWHWKITGHLFYVISSFLHHFIAVCEFKLDSQSGYAQVGSNLEIFLSVVTLKFDGWPWKTTGHLFFATYNFVHLFIAIWESGITVRTRPNCHLCDFVLWSLTWTFCTDITSVNANYSWKFRDDTMRGTLWKGCVWGTDGGTEGRGPS